jgi:hypothetical protein
MSRFQVVLRAFLYLYFSVFAGLTAAGLVGMILIASKTGRIQGLPGSGTVAWATAALIILALLVFGQWEQFGERIRLLKWIPLCILLTIAAFAASLLSSGPLTSGA